MVQYLHSRILKFQLTRLNIVHPWKLWFGKCLVLDRFMGCPWVGYLILGNIRGQGWLNHDDPVVYAQHSQLLPLEPTVLLAKSKFLLATSQIHWQKPDVPAKIEILLTISPSLVAKNHLLLLNSIWSVLKTLSFHSTGWFRTGLPDYHNG